MGAMGATQDVPGPRPAERAEIVHTRITRLLVSGRPVVRKEPLGPDAERRLRREAGILERVRGVDGVAQLVDGPRYPDSVVLADAGTTTLAGLATPLAVDELIGVAVGLARAVAGMHRCGVLHRDITPANVVVSGDGTPCLVDFALATSVAELRPGFTHYSEIVGTLAYLAPESTGRTGRPVDQRADLYALGATLYEAATGAPPFGTVDPLTLIHDHLARVPVPPAERNTALPAALSQIILHLLEKEPDRRYQSADGLLFDLERLRDADAQAAAELRIGARDLPLRLLPPSRLVGREADVVALDEAFQKALVGRCRAVLVGGAPGVGKTVLVDQLRSVVTGGDGWFVAGKFDQYRRDLDFDGVHQASRALGRLLLAEPEGELAGVRERLLRALGPNAGLAAAALPEFATLLAVPPDAGDPLTAQVRAQRTAVEILRAVASRKRPLVFFVDDLQWAGRTPLGVFDLLLSEEPIEGLLLVGAYREDDVSTTHPLAPTLSRWRYEAGVQQLRLENLPAPALADLVAEMLHVGPAAAHNLAGVIGPHTSGNPYVTVELLDALRRGGLLTATVDGWRWDDAAVRARLGDSEEASFVQARVSALPAAARQVVEAMACLGGRAEAGLLQTAIGQPAAVVEQAVAPALEDGLLVTEPGVHSAVRFRHDRLREAILRGLDPPRRRALQLGMARRLAGVPELFALAAEQYLPVVDAVTDSQERQEVVGLLRRAADQAAVIGDQARMSTLLAAALGLVDPGDTATLIELRTGNHAALFGLGRLDEADDDYRTIEALCPAVIDRLDATALQVRSLTHRTRFADATALGLDALRELGITVPAADRLPAELEHQFAHLYRWVDHSADEDAARPEITDPRLLAATRLMNAVLPAAQVDLALLAWLSLEGLRILLEHGSGRTLLGPASHAGIVAVVLRGDYGAGYRAVQRVVALGEARGYEPDTSQARLLFAHSCCWFEPIEQGVEAARRAREGLIAGGELTNAGYTYSATMMYLIDCAPSLDVYAAEAESGLAFARRTSDELIRQVLEPDLWLAGVLRGETSAAAGEAMLARYTDNPAALLFGHIRCAIAASIFDDSDSLARHAAAAMPLLPATLGHYPTAIARVLRGLALAGQARTTDSDQRGALLAELDEQIDWLASRAVDAPDNFAHLLRLLEAERAWATGDSWAAVLAFDAARREAAARPRPWHRALITERAARFHLTHGLDGTGHELLAHARDQYAAWGATAKVAQLGWAQPSLQSAAGPTARGDGAPDRTAPHQRATVAAGTVDLLGILAASQALSSQTRLDRLHARVVEVLGALTGATAVHLVIWDEDRRDWLLPTQDGGAGPVGAGHEATVPLSVLRYVQRTGEPLVVADATSDDRFARDPYLTDVACCSLLAVPILSRGALRAVLLLENRLLRGAFTTNRLDAVTLVAGQLAVSLDNAQLYAQLTNSRARIVTAGDAARRRIERNLHDGAQQRLVALALQLRTVQAEVPPEAGRLRERLGDLAAEANGALDELREIARGLHPAALARGGLPRALPSLARRCPVPVHLAVHIDGRLPDPIELAAYYTVAEALTNTAKHAHATAVDIGIHTDGDRLRIDVRDDGRGGADPHAGSGLLGLKDRIEALGGLFVVHSPPGSGTTLQIALPLDDPSRGEPSS